MSVFVSYLDCNPEVHIEHNNEIIILNLDESKELYNMLKSCIKTIEYNNMIKKKTEDSP